MTMYVCVCVSVYVRVCEDWTGGGASGDVASLVNLHALITLDLNRQRYWKALSVFISCFDKAVRLDFSIVKNVRAICREKSHTRTNTHCRRLHTGLTVKINASAAPY